MPRIVVTQRAETHCTGAWTACPENEPGTWEAGATPNEAIGALAITLRGRLGLEFEFKAFPPKDERRARALEATHS